MSNNREGRGWGGDWGEPRDPRCVCIRVGAGGVQSADHRPH